MLCIRLRKSDIPQYAVKNIWRNNKHDILYLTRKYIKNSLYLGRYEPWRGEQFSERT